MKYDIEPDQTNEGSRHTIDRPLFGDAVDSDEDGCLVVLSTGQIAAVTPVQFIPEGGDTSLEGNRLQPQPFWIVNDEIVWMPEDTYDPAAPTIGVELELAGMTNEGEWHELSVDGKTLVYPDGIIEPAENQGHALESLSVTHECGSDAPFPRGYDDFRRQTDILKREKWQWLGSHGLAAPPISMYPEVIDPTTTSQHPITRMLGREDVLPKFLEFAGSMSEQLNIQMKDPQAALFAINAYQILQPVLNNVTAASAIRNGSFETTLRDHYKGNTGFDETGHTAFVELATLVQNESPKSEDPVSGKVKDFYDSVPHDWRALARAYGSRSGGIISRATPLTLEEFLREGDRQLRSGETLAIDRTLGWHTDRLRPGKGVIEVCNLSHAGQHPEKIAAAEETVIKVIVALQEYYANPHIYKEEWAGIIPRPGELDDIGARQKSVDVANVNNKVSALYGKDRNFYDTDWNERTGQEIYDAFFDFANTYAPEAISIDAREEVAATLRPAPPVEVFEPANADQVFDYFYLPRSTMSAAEALRIAHKVAPVLPVSKILLKMARASVEANRFVGRTSLDEEVKVQGLKAA